MMCLLATSQASADVDKTRLSIERQYANLLRFFRQHLV